MSNNIYNSTHLETIAFGATGWQYFFGICKKRKHPLQ